MISLPIYKEDYYRKCMDTLDTALGYVPAYKSWSPYDPGSRYSVDERYKALPILRKDDFKKISPENLVPVGRDIMKGIQDYEIELVTSIGIMGEKTKIVWYQPWWDITEQMSWELNTNTINALLGKHREAILTSALCVGILSDDIDLPFHDRQNGRFFYLNEKSSPLLWQQYHLERMVIELQKFKPVVLEANPSFLSRFTRYIMANNISVYQPSLIVLTYELLSKLDYQVIRQVFNCPICSSYGSTEAGHIFMECEYGRFHQNTTCCRVDLEPLESECVSSDIYRVIVTTFDNAWRVLLRYDTDDLCKATMVSTCPCGRREGWLVDQLEGRASNLTMTVDGKLVTEQQVDAVLSGLNFSMYQLIQTSANDYLLRFTANGGVGQNCDLAIENLKRLYGSGAKIQTIEQDIQLEKSGKYRRVYSTLRSY